MFARSQLKIRAGLLLLALSLTLAGCGQRGTEESAGAAPSNSPGSEASAGAEGDTPTLRIQVLEEGALAEGTYWQYIESEEGVCLVITPTAAVRSFKFATVKVKEGESEVRYTMDDVRCLYDELTPDKPFVVKLLPVGTLPTYGVAFTDQNDQSHLYTINVSGLGPEEGGGYFLQKVN